jgi:DNA-binding MarR family transcriptional regulator
VGLSQVEKDETMARKDAEAIFPSESIRAILNVSAPNAYLMLERAYVAVTNALRSKASQVLPEHVIEQEAEVQVPTTLEYSILKELRKGRLTPADLSERLDKKTPSIVRSLAKMMQHNWVVRVGAGKRAYYSLTARGEAATRRKERS